MLSEAELLELYGPLDPPTEKRGRFVNPNKSNPSAVPNSLVFESDKINNYRISVGDSQICINHDNIYIILNVIYQGTIDTFVDFTVSINNDKYFNTINSLFGTVVLNRIIVKGSVTLCNVQNFVGFMFVPTNIEERMFARPSPDNSPDFYADLFSSRKIYSLAISDNICAMLYFAISDNTFVRNNKSSLHSRRAAADLVCRLRGRGEEYTKFYPWIDYIEPNEEVLNAITELGWTVTP